MESGGGKAGLSTEGELFCPEAPSGVEEKNGEGAAGNEFRDFLDEERAEDGSEHSSEGTGGGDFPVDRVEFPISEGNGEGDGNDESEGGADGDVVGDAAEEGEGGDDEGAASDAKAAGGEAGQKADEGVEEETGGHGRTIPTQAEISKEEAGRDAEACQKEQFRLT